MRSIVVVRLDCECMIYYFYLCCKYETPSIASYLYPGILNLRYNIPSYSN